jgi:hypothetical protein
MNLTSTPGTVEAPIGNLVTSTHRIVRLRYNPEAVTNS